MHIVPFLLLVPVVGGSAFSLLCLWACSRFFAHKVQHQTSVQPPVTVLKPCYGLDRDMAANLESICEQSYPVYQVVLSLQRPDDPCLPLLREFEAQYPDKVTIVIEERPPTFNGKVENMVIGLTAARYDYLVINDSDARVGPDYLSQMVAPLADPKIGYVCSLYRARGGTNIPEKLDLLSMNADFVPSLVFSAVTGASDFCLGASTALRKTDLDAIGGMQSLATYMVEDYEMGRRLRAMGLGFKIIPTWVDLIADYPDMASWWSHNVYWDQNTWAANRLGFFMTILTRSIPFAFLYAVTCLFNSTSLLILAVAILLRIITAAIICGRYIESRESVGSLWLLPLRDILGLVSWVVAQTRRSSLYRGNKLTLSRQGRIINAEQQGI